MNISRKRLTTFLLFCSCMMCAWTQEKDYPIIIEGDMEFYQYTPGTGEGLFSISRRFGVPLTEIVRYNSSIEENGLKLGDIVLVPILKKSTNKYHIIAPQETLYGVSRKYGVSIEELMAANLGISEHNFPIGREIVIPESSGSDQPSQPAVQTATIRYTPTEEPETSDSGLPSVYAPDNYYTRNTKNAEQKTGYSVALLLPFTGKEVSSANNSYVEYYEGFLLAVDSMKTNGLSIDLYVYDTGLAGQPVNLLLEKEELKNADLIIGGIEKEEIRELSEFSVNTGIKYLIPFSAKHDEEWMNPTIFQINPTQSIVHTRAANAYASRMRNKNILFVNCPEDSGNKQEFIRLLKLELDEEQTPYFDIRYSENLGEEIKKHLVDDSENIILPTSSSAKTLQNIASPLRAVVNAGIADIILYGYPEWQIHAKEALDDLFLLNVHFYTTFYVNNISPEIKNFHNKYRFWYNKNLLSTYPKYGLMGFDTGMYFLNALNKFGTDFDQNLERCTIPSLQTSFYFEQNRSNGGYINANLFMVEFTPDFTVIKSIVQ